MKGETKGIRSIPKFFLSLGKGKGTFGEATLYYYITPVGDLNQHVNQKSVSPMSEQINKNLESLEYKVHRLKVKDCLYSSNDKKDPNVRETSGLDWLKHTSYSSVKFNKACFY